MRCVFWIRDELVLLSLPATMHVSGNQEAEVRGSPFTITPNNSLVEFLFPISNTWALFIWRSCFPKKRIVPQRTHQWFYWTSRWNCHLAIRGFSWQTPNRRKGITSLSGNRVIGLNTKERVAATQQRHEEVCLWPKRFCEVSLSILVFNNKS